MNNPGGDPSSDMVGDFLPSDYEYNILSCQVQNASEKALELDLHVRVDVKTEAEVKLFLSALNTSSGCSFNLRGGRPDKRQEAGGRGLSQVRGFRKCCFNVDKSKAGQDKQPGKNTDCEAAINFRLENPIGKDKYERENRLKFPLWVKIHFHHNHSTQRAEFFKFLNVSDETKEDYLGMFEQGLLPSSAHSERKRCIKAAYPDTWPHVFADRSKLPSIFWVHKCHRQFLDKTVGSKDGVDAYERAEEAVRQFDRECKLSNPLAGDRCYAKIAQSNDGETAVVIVDPFMHRVHETMPQSGDLVLVDATSNLGKPCKPKITIFYLSQHIILI